MKLLQCELCGSNDLIKRDGLFVCEYCGAKYTVEEARNLFIDGPVSVKIDNNELYDNSIHLMKVALSETRYDDAYAAIQDALRIKPLSPYLQAMQAIAFFGREGVHGKIPLPTSKGLESAKMAFDKETDIVAIRDYARDLRTYLPAAFQYVKDECNRKIKELRDLRDMTVPGTVYNTHASNQQNMGCMSRAEGKEILAAAEDDDFAKVIRLFKKYFRGQDSDQVYVEADEWMPISEVIHDDWFDECKQIMDLMDTNIRVCFHLTGIMTGIKKEIA